MEKLDDFITKRRKELLEGLAPLMEQRAQIEARIHRLRKELSRLDQAGRAIGLAEAPPEFELTVERRTRPELTIKQAVVEVLRDHPQGLTALEILDKVNESFDLGIVRTSLSPQLSRLKNDDQKIGINDSTWFLLPEKNEGSAK